MTGTTLIDDAKALPELKGHAVGFVDTRNQCDIVVQNLIVSGVAETAILVFSGDDGTQLFKQMMQGQLWGEAAEDLLKQGTIELSHGHLALMVESQDRNQALLVTNLCTKFGGHGFSYFGGMTDERLTR